MRANVVCRANRLHSRSCFTSERTHQRHSRELRVEFNPNLTTLVFPSCTSMALIGYAMKISPSQFGQLNAFEIQLRQSTIIAPQGRQYIGPA